MSRTENALRNGITGFINKMIVMLIPFVLRTVLIHKLGVEYLGLNNLFTSILQVLNVTELGFNSAIVFSMYKPIAQKDEKTINALMNFYKKVYRVIGVIILIIGIAIMPFLKYLINGSYPSDINIYILYLIYLFNTVITYFLFAYKNVLLVAHQRSDLSNNVNTAVFIIQYIFQIIILCVYKNYYLYIIVNTFTVIANNIICARIAKKKYPQYKSEGKLEKSEIKNLSKRIYGLIVQRICVTTRNSLDSIFISAFLGLEVVAIYGNYYSIMAAIISLMGIVTSSITAGIGNSIVTESVDKNYNDMNKFNFIYMWISGVCTVCLLCLYQPFMQLWMGEEYMFPFSVVICLCIYFYALKIGVIRGAYSDAAGLWWETRHRAIIESILNIILNFILGKIWGIYGIILATLISLLIVNFGYGSQIVFKYYFKGKKVQEYFKSNALYALNTFIVCVITYAICLLLPEYGILSIIGKAIICAIVPNIYYLIVYVKKPIFKEVIRFIKGMVGKIAFANKICDKLLKI